MPNMPSIEALIQQRLQRRTLLKAGATAATAMASGSITACSSKTATSSPWQFTEIPHKHDDKLHVPEEYEEPQVLIRWGDSLSTTPLPPAEKLNAQQQQQAFGFNNDFIAYIPINGSSEHGLLCVNNEYPSAHMMFPGFADKKAARFGANAEQQAIMQAAVGHSIVEIKLVKQQWQVVTDSPYNRRIHLHTPVTFSGPAAGDQRLKTRANPDGLSGAGTMGNCAGGKTPWGTVLTAEENFSKYFSGNIDKLPATEQNNLKRLKTSTQPSYAKTDKRFDLEDDFNYFNHFGWIVEIDPLHPEKAPQKRTALGRFQHEGATIVSTPGQPIVVYMGDDGKHEYVYKFVSQEVFDPKNDNSHLLDNGILYVARFNDNGILDWLPMVHGQGPLNKDNGFHNQADVLIEARRAARTLKATPMDRPEDIETNPVSGYTYVMLTKNNKRSNAEKDKANPRAENIAGHILELRPPTGSQGIDHTAQQYRWDILLLAGDPQSTQGAHFHHQTSNAGWFACPDNVAFNPLGDMWVATDGCEDFGFNDGLWAVDTSTTLRGYARHFLSCPKGAELCGPEFTPDGKTLFASIQHPGSSDGANFDKPSSRWPLFKDDRPPLPAVIAIRHKKGHIIGR